MLQLGIPIGVTMYSPHHHQRTIRMSRRDPQVDLFSNLMLDSIYLQFGGMKATRRMMDGPNGCYFHLLREKNQDISQHGPFSSGI